MFFFFQDASSVLRATPPKLPNFPPFLFIFKNKRFFQNNELLHRFGQASFGIVRVVIWILC
jgi:hypothetical protein